MNQGRIIVITGAPGTGKTTTASVVAKESDLEKSVHMHTDDFYHYLSKGAIHEQKYKIFSNLGIYELNVIDTTTHSIKDTVSAVKEKIVSGTALLF